MTPSQIQEAIKFNKRAAKKVFDPDSLPHPFRDHAPSTEGFALLVEGFQKEQGLLADGKLGDDTYNRLKVKYPPKVQVPDTRPAPPSNWKNRLGVKVPIPSPGSRDGWEGALSVVDAAIWDEKNDPDLAPDKIRSLDDLKACVGHTTGYGAGVERLDRQFGMSPEGLIKTDLAYAKRMATNLEYKGSFLIGRTGYTVQFSPLKYRTYHTSSVFQSIYAQANWAQTRSVTKRGGKVGVRVSDWPGMFPEIESPLEMPAFMDHGKGRSINLHTWSFDILAPKGNDPYTDAQFEAAARLIYHVHCTFKLPIDKFHVCGHDQVNPLDRSDNNGLWDLGPRWSWQRVFDRIMELEAEVFGG